MRNGIDFQKVEQADTIVDRDYIELVGLLVLFVDGKISEEVLSGYEDLLLGEAVDFTINNETQKIAYTVVINSDVWEFEIPISVLYEMCEIRERYRARESDEA